MQSIPRNSTSKSGPKLTDISLGHTAKVRTFYRGAQSGDKSDVTTSASPWHFDVL